MEIEVKTAAANSLDFSDLKPGDVFTWGNGTYWYLKGNEGYADLETGYYTPDVLVLGAGSHFAGLRLAKKATLLIEE